METLAAEGGMQHFKKEGKERQMVFSDFSIFTSA